MSIDWLQQFEKQFSGDDVISTLGKRKFYGKVEINFQAGKPVMAYVHMSIKPPKQEMEVKSGGS